MQVQKKQLSDTKLQLAIHADEEILSHIKHEVLEHLNRTQVKLQGFRKGKAPLSFVEKQLDPAVLQSEFLDKAVNRLYVNALTQEKIRPVEQPEIAIKKFVPFTTLEFEATLEAIGEVTLPDYKNIKLTKQPVKITDNDVKEVIEALRVRAAEKKEVTRAAEKDDEVIIDFLGTDAETKEPIPNADGKGYPLTLGSNTFIPGFEDNLIGMKPGDDKSFIVTFPKGYGVPELQNRKVNFATTVNKVNALVKPDITDEFAATIGPFKTVADLKADIKKQVEIERHQQAKRAYENELIEKITTKSKIPLPKVLVEDEVDRIEEEERQSVIYRGQTWPEHLKEEGVTDEEHRNLKRPTAEQRVRAGLMLSAVAEKEKIDVTTEELEARLQILKSQYEDETMQAELDKPEHRRELASRLVSEKTIQKLTEYAQAQ